MRRLLVLVLLAVAVSPPVPAAATPPGARDVTVQLFQWNWASVGRECRDFIGPRGLHVGAKVS